MVQEWRVLIDQYNAENEGDTKVLFTEAYASVANTVRYYQADDGSPRAHFPFNFILIEQLDEAATADEFKDKIDEWLNAVPEGGTSNWVVSGTFQLNHFNRLFWQSIFSPYKSWAIMINRDLRRVMARREWMD